MKWNCLFQGLRWGVFNVIGETGLDKLSCLKCFISSCKLLKERLSRMKVTPSPCLNWLSILKKRNFKKKKLD